MLDRSKTDLNIGEGLAPSASSLSQQPTARVLAANELKMNILKCMRRR
jgi:hypothetical protein